MNPRSPARLFVALCFVLLAFVSGLAGRAVAQIQYFTVALSGQAAPGTPAGVNYQFFGMPVPNDAGQTAYFATLTGNRVTEVNNVAIYAGPLNAPQLVARTGDAAPGTPAGVNYLRIDTPALSDAGQAAYRAEFTGIGVTGANSFAIYAGPLDAPQLVARLGSTAPSIPGGVNYLFLDLPVLNDAGQLAYRADAEGSAIFAGTFGAPQLVARAGGTAPGTPAGVNYSFFEPPVLNDAGQLAYLATLTGSGVTSANNVAIYTGPQAAPQLVARTGGAAPGTPNGVNYLSLSTPALNDVGQAAFFAALTGSGVTSANDGAIYAGPPAAPQLVAREGDAAPDTPAGVKYLSFSPPTLNEAGQAAYRALLTGSGVTFANNEAIYAGPLAAPQLVARGGDAAPGMPAGINYSGFGLPALNESGQAAYVAFLAGSGVTDANDHGLFAHDPALGGLLIARNGDLFDVGGGELRRIREFDIDFLVGRGDDELTGLSNDGTLAFRLYFTDGSTGVFTARIIPEPSGLALLVAASLTIVGCRSVIGRRVLARM